MLDEQKDEAAIKAEILKHQNECKGIVWGDLFQGILQWRCKTCGAVGTLKIQLR